MAQPWNDDHAYDPHEIDAWIAIDPDDSILIRYQRAEMGQGSMTALPMMITEELQCDWSKVRIEYASPNRNIRENKVYGDMFSNGSRSVRASQKKMQQVGASARERLIAAAAARWNVPAQECTAAASVVTHGPSGPHAALRRGRRRCGEGHARQGAGDQDAGSSSPSSASRCRASTWSHKIDGSAKFGIDAQIPGMVFAAINACPVPGGKLKSVDESPARRRARRAQGGAARRTRWRWSRPAATGAPSRRSRGCSPNGMSARPATSTAHSSRRRFARRSDEPDADRAQRRRCRSRRSPGAAKTFEAIYETPYLSHSPMEPMNATVHLQPDRLDVWVGTQAARRRAPRRRRTLAGLKPEQVYIHNAFVGGGFGRRDANDEVAQAIAIAKAVQRPVKLIWTREEDTRQDKFRPHAVVRFKAGVGADGMPTAWSMRVVTSSILATVGRPLPPNKPEPMAVAGLGRQRLQRAEHARRGAASRTRTCRCGSGARPARTSTSSRSRASSTRSARRPGSIPIRSGASCSKASPTGSRCSTPRPRRATGASRCRKGSGRGIAICEDTDSLCAQVAEVTVKPNGEVKVNRVTVALDTRYMVNPLTIAEQAEGGVIFGLSAALYGKITIKNGVPVQGNFDTYRMVRLAEAPKIDVHLAAERRQGLGRRGRARDAADRRRGRERDLRRYRQAHSQPADHRPRSVEQSA